MAQKVLEEIQAVGRSFSQPSAVASLSHGYRSRLLEAVPGIVSWTVVLAPIWITLLNARLGIMFVTLATMYFAFRASYFGVRSLRNRARVLQGVRRDWLRDLKVMEDQRWRHYRVTLLIRAFREGNREMLRETLESIYRSKWPKVGTLMRNVEVVFATEEDDPITPPIVEDLAKEFSARLKVRQIKHPAIPGHLPGPSSAMHYAGKVLYEEALESDFSPHQWLIADFDCDTLFHPQYLPCLVYTYATDPLRQKHAYQPVVLFTTDYWNAPLHSRLSAVGTSVLTLAWNRRPEVAFTGSAASLALLKTVDFWPTNSHSQDSGIELRLRLRHGKSFAVVGLPLPLSVYPVMAIGPRDCWWGKAKTYAQSFRTLFRQSARWREGSLDEFVESVLRGHPGWTVRKLWNGLERDTLTLLPAVGPVVAQLVVGVQGREDVAQLTAPLAFALAALLTVVSCLGLLAFGQVLVTRQFLPAEAPLWRKGLELITFWLVFSVYIPIITACAGLRTSTAYLMGDRPRGHYLPTPK